MHRLTIVFALLAVSACSSDKKKDAPAATPGGEPPAAGQSKPAVTPAPSAAKLSCDKVLPQAMRDKYFAGAKITDNPQPIDSAAECKIEDGSPAGSKVSVTCHDNMAAAMDMSLKALREQLKADDLPGVGKGAATVDMGPGGRMVSAWDDDSNCQVTLSIPTTIDPVVFTKELLATYPLK